MMSASVTERLMSAERRASVEKAVNLAPRVPEHFSRDRQIALFIFLSSLGYLLLFRRYTTMEPDEGIVLQGAQRILRGQVVYRDFFSYFTPGSYYWLAFLFKIFGSSFTLARTVLAVIGAGFSVVSYMLMRRVCSTEVSFFVASLVTLTTLPFRFLVLHNWDSTLCAGLAVYFAVRMIELPRVSWAVATSSFASLCFLFEQSKGAGLCLGLGTGLLLIGSKDPRLRNRTLMAAMATGLVWPVILTVIYFAARHSLALMVADWFWPLQHYSTANHVPYGYQNWSDGTLGGAFDCCRGSEPHFSGSGSAVASPRHWRVLDVSALAATNCRSQMLLLRADLRNLGGTSAFNRDRQSGHFTFHVSAAALLFATRLGHGWTRYSQTNLPAPPALADRLCRNRRSAVCRALAAENVERAFSSCNPPWRSKHSCARYCY